MATLATDIISVAQMANQLRIPAPTADEAGMIELAIRAGVSRVTAYTGIPLLDTTAKLMVSRVLVYGWPSVPLSQRNIKAIIAVKYWPVGQDLREEPSKEIDVANLGRLEYTGRAKLRVYPPADGWPDADMFRFEVTVGFDITPSTEVFKFGCILAAREAYEGRLNSDFVNNSFRVLLAPLRDWTM